MYSSVLLFEEPEAHSYGPFIYELAQHILNDKGGNQYFLTTHNTYLLLPLMQEGQDVAVFATWFEDYQYPPETNLSMNWIWTKANKTCLMTRMQMLLTRQIKANAA